MGTPQLLPANASAGHYPSLMRCPVAGRHGGPWGPKSGLPWRRDDATAEAASSATPMASAPCSGALASASLPGPMGSLHLATSRACTTALGGNPAKEHQAQHPVGGGRLDLQRSLSCSHEQFSFPEYCPPSANSTPASTPELARRSSGLARSRSQPCVLNDKKIGVKRRRPDEVQEQRPSLDLAKMAQNCQTFSSLSCLNMGVDDHSSQSPFALVSSTRSWTALLSASSPGGRTPAGTPVPEPVPHSFDDQFTCQEDLSCDESDGCSLDEDCCRKGDPATSWRDRGACTNSLCSLDGELDIEQIENN